MTPDSLARKVDYVLTHCPPINAIYDLLGPKDRGVVEADEYMVWLQEGMAEGLCVVYCPHTTAAMTINENADPDVQHDLLMALAATFPDCADSKDLGKTSEEPDA